MRSFLLRLVAQQWLRLDLEKEQREVENTEAYKRYWRLRNSK